MARQMALFSEGETRPQERTYRIHLVRLEMVKEASLKAYARTISTPADAAGLVRPLLENADREHFLVLCLNIKNQVNAIQTISVGTLNSSVVHPREVFKVAIMANAASVILAHNHPTGDPSPSREDRDTTARLVQCGRILGIEVLDHVVIGSEGRYLSFKQAGLL